MRVLVLGLGAIAALAVVATHTTACVQIPDQGKQPALATHVVDWRDEVIYQVLIDRFADGNINNNFGVRPGALARHQGGDWRGLEDHLGYLQEMGVTTLWISPIVKNVETDADVDSYHGYWAQDLTQLNPHFGDLASLRSLVASAHDRNMKVVLDIVTNHMGQAFYYDMNLNGHPDIYIGGTGTTSPLTRVSEYDPDWDARGVQAQTSLGLDGRAPMIFIDDPAINRVPPGCIDTLSPDGRCILGSPRGYHGFGRILNYDDDKQRMLGDFPGGLKDVATELDEVRQVMIDSYARWVELLDLDGFRIDTVKHVEHEFWQVFSKAVRQRLAAQGKANFLMFGEAFDGNDELLGSFTRPGELDSVFYFSQHFQVFRDVFQNAHDVKAQKGTSQIKTLWESRAKSYGSAPQENGIGVAPTKALVNFLDNHDVSRFLFEAQGDVPALRNALTLLLTEDGIPCVYYGTEQDFAGGNDPANREVLWTTGFATTGDTFRHVSKLAGLRRDYVALRRGDTKVVYATDHVGDESDAGVFAFERAAGDAGASYALVVMNTNARHKSTTSDASGMKVNAAAGSSLVDVLDPARTAYAVGSDQTLRLTLGAQSAMVLVPSGQVVH